MFYSSTGGLMKVFFFLMLKNLLQFKFDFFLFTCIFFSQIPIPVDQFYSDTSTMRYSFNLWLNKQVFWQNSSRLYGRFPYWLSYKMSFQLFTLWKKVDDSFWKIWQCTNQKLKPSSLFLAYQAILSSGAHNSVNFQQICYPSLNFIFFFEESSNLVIYVVSSPNYFFSKFLTFLGGHVVAFEGHFIWMNFKMLMT